MKMPVDLQFRSDLVKLGFLCSVVTAIAFVFAVNPALSTPTFLGIVIAMLLSPWVAALERRGLSRGAATSIVFLGILLLMGGVGFWVAQSFEAEWSGLKEKAPDNFRAAIQALRGLEGQLKARHPFLGSVNPTESLLGWGEETGRWFVDNGAALAGSILTWLLIVPPLTFVMLTDGRSMWRRFYQLVPNRYFESLFLVSTEITSAISDYLRAKLVEALLVGTMTTIGLLAIHAPYAVVLGIAAGLTNIIPYLGPLLGAAPAILVAGFDSSAGGATNLMFPVTMVYVVVNVIDTVIIFPVVVAKLVNLHPLILIAVVAIGQRYYGLIGMLVSIPIATGAKVILAQVHRAIYDRRAAVVSAQTYTDEEILQHAEL